MDSNQENIFNHIASIPHNIPKFAVIKQFTIEAKKFVQQVYQKPKNFQNPDYYKQLFLNQRAQQFYSKFPQYDERNRKDLSKNFPHISILPKGSISKQTYSYSDIEQLDYILKSTDMKYYKIHQKEKLEGLVFIHVGQLLDLFQNILEYIRLLELKNINHDYLDSNRIWLFMDENSQFPNVVSELMKYRIVLTGYQCPFYEDSSQQLMKASNKIIQILIGIIFSLQSKKCWFVRDEENINKVKSIYQKIIILNTFSITLYSQFTITLNLTKFIQLIKEIKQTYHYNNQTQMLDFDINSDYLQFRIEKSLLLAQEIQNQFTKFDGQNQLYLDYTFKQLVPLYEEYLVQDTELPQIQKEFQDLVQDEFEEQSKQMYEHIKEFIKYEVNKEIENFIKTMFKFEFSDEEIKEINNDILIEFDKAKIKNYFENSIWFYQKEIQKEQVILFQQIVRDLITKRIKLSLENKILKMIIELI